MRLVAYHNHVIFTRSQTNARLSLLLLFIVSYCYLLSFNLQLLARCNEHADTIETLTFVEPNTGHEHHEFAFRAPMKGLPRQPLDVFCSSVRMRLYWGVFRDEIKETRRKGLYLRRMARLAKHIFDDIRDIDKPFNATMLSQVDKYFGVSKDPVDKSIDKSMQEDSSKLAKAENFANKSLKKLKTKLVNGFQKTPLVGAVLDNKQQQQQLDSDDQAQQQQQQAMRDGDVDVDGSSDGDDQSSEAMRELEQEGNVDAKRRIKRFIKKWAPKVALGVYTRWRTMWWMMMSCLFAKYYLWDPALDEFTKLKRSLVMWPELQLVKLQELSCKPVQLFKRLLDVCKLLNPLMHIDFGQLSLDKMTRFQ